MTARFTPLSPGVWQILPTPFRGTRHEVDHDSLRILVEHARGSGVVGVVALGVLGEAAKLSAAERVAVLETVQAAAGPLPVVSGISALATAPAIEQAVAAADVGANAVMLLVSSGRAAELAEHARAVSDACDRGVVFQDHPASTGVSIGTAALVEAIEISGVGVAVKAEAPPTVAAVAAVAAALALPVFGGLGGVGLLDELLAGADGAMTGFAYPEGLVAAFRAFTSGGFPAARGALAPYLPLIVFEAQLPVSLALRKELLRRRGLIAEATVRPPGPVLPAWAVPLIDAHLVALDADRAVRAQEVPA
jgi:4-hydroxy-tetrahydrodipicolinate synthase